VFFTLSSPGDTLSYLLYKHPSRVQGFDLAFGNATVFYPQADENATQVALLVDVDSTDLARSKRFKVSGFELGHYVNDRAYAASSLLSVAIAKVFRSALIGQDPAERPGEADKARDLDIHVPSVRSRGGSSLVRNLFEPLGWEVETSEYVPTCVDLTLHGHLTLKDALSHLYVLLPVLDDAKHYWVGDGEIDKLMRHAQGWLADHPAREVITQRYLAHQKGYVADATARLLGEDIEATPSCQPPKLSVQRTDFLVATLTALGVHKVLDLGCGEGKLVRALLGDPRFEVLGADVSSTVLARAEASLERLSDRQRERVSFIQASATYRDTRFSGFDALVLSEVVEHLDPDRLDSLERTVFGYAQPTHVLVTTPNAEYNALYGMEDGAMRHSDHRFEWTRSQFQQWAGALAQRTGYTVSFEGVGDEDPQAGFPTQAAVFTKERSA
jgi:3' terminal RNA ribose 2'-O-methyltransferase Hen1